MHTAWLASFVLGVQMPQRYEIIKLDAIEKVEKTPEGFLRLPARVTRTGIFLYRKADGSIVKELRPPKEVFNEDSLTSLLSKPLTNNHPGEGRVDSTNAKVHTVGFTSDSVQQEDKFVRIFLNVIDESTIKDIMNGKQELSCGYTCEVEQKSGEHNGERYDSVQHNIRYNHVALVHRGRAGADVRLSLDDSDAILEEQHEDELSHRNTSQQLRTLIGKQYPKKHIWIRDVFDDYAVYSVDDSEELFKQDYRIRDDTVELLGGPTKVIQKTQFITKKEDSMEFESIKIDEKEIKVAKEDSEALKAHLDSQAEKISSLESDASKTKELKEDLDNTETLLDKANGKITGYKATITDLEKKLDGFEEKVKTAASERAKLHKIAESVLDSEQLEKLDDMESVEIKKAIIAKKSDIKLDEASENHIDSCFEVICNLKDSPKDTLGSDIVDNRQDSATEPVKDAREKSIERMKTAYKRDKED